MEHMRFASHLGGITLDSVSRNSLRLVCVLPKRTRKWQSTIVWSAKTVLRGKFHGREVEPIHGLQPQATIAGGGGSGRRGEA